MDELIDRIKRKHIWAPPLRETDELLKEFERSQGFRLPEDLKSFYRRCAEASLFGQRYRFVSLTELCYVSRAVFGDDSEDHCPHSWYAFCDMLNGDFVGIDLATDSTSGNHIFDCNHEDMGSCLIIAQSFVEFLTQALDSADEIYWLDEGFAGYGYVWHDPPPSYYRRVNAEFWGGLGPEIGPEQCTTIGCDRRRIQYSAKCRRHHYEMIQHHPCPFED